MKSLIQYINESSTENELTDWLTKTLSDLSNKNTISNKEFQEISLELTRAAIRLNIKVLNKFNSASAKTKPFIGKRTKKSLHDDDELLDMTIGCINDEGSYVGFTLIPQNNGEYKVKNIVDVKYFNICYFLPKGCKAAFKNIK